MFSMTSTASSSTGIVRRMTKISHRPTKALLSGISPSPLCRCRNINTTSSTKSRTVKQHVHAAREYLVDEPRRTALDTALSDQDPYKRIRYEQPVSFLGSRNHAERLARAKQVFPSAKEIHPFLIPFWSIYLLCDQTLVTRHRKTNGMNYNNAPERQQTDMGICIAAVGKDHWASGAWYPDHVRSSIWTNDDIHQAGPNLSGFKPTDSTDIYTEWQYKDILEPFLNDSHQQWSPYTAPKFTLPPPRLERSEMETLSSLQAEVFTDWEELLELNKPIRIYAIPKYRFVYKADLPRGFALVDGEALNPLFNSYALEVTWPRGEAMPVNHGRYGNALGYSMRKRQIPRIDDEPATFHFNPATSKGNTFVNTLFKAMHRRGAMTPAMWEDERILPFVAPEGTVSARTLREYADRMIADKPVKGEPLFPIKRDETSFQSSLFAPRSTQSQTSSKTASGAKSNNSNASSSGSGGSESASFKKAGSSQEQRAYTTSWAEKREAYTRERAKLHAGKVRDTMRQNAGATSTMSSIGASRIGIGRFPKILPDPLGFYSTLDIREPISTDYLSNDPLRRIKMDNRIKSVYAQKSLLLHPDRGGDRDQFEVLAIAKEALETQANRMIYFQTGKARKH